MMKRLLLCLSSLCLILNLSLQSQSLRLDWVNTYGTANDDNGYCLTSVNGTDLTFIGNFGGGNFVVNNSTYINMGGQDLFLMKMNTSGTMKWSHQIAGNGLDINLKTAEDNLGNTYLMGIFGGADVTLGNFSATNGSISGRDVFMSKLDPTGTPKWFKHYTGDFNEYLYGIDMVGNENIVISGYFNSPIMSLTQTTLTQSSSSSPPHYMDGFVAKLDSAGNEIWVESTKGGSIGRESLHNHVVDAAGNIYALGYFNNHMSFPNFTLTSNGDQDICLIKFDPSGNALWGKAIGGVGMEYGWGSGFIVTDSLGNVYFNSFFQSPSITVGNTTLTNTNPGTYDILIAKYDPKGNPIWLESFGGTGDEIPHDMHIGKKGDLFLTGSFSSPVISANNFSLVNAGNGTTDILIVKMDQNGKFIFAERVGGTGDDEGFGIFADGWGKLYLSGSFTGSVAFDPGPTHIPPQAFGSKDVFVACFNDLTHSSIPNVNTLPTGKDMVIYPNPTSGMLHIDVPEVSPGYVQVNIYDQYGRLIYRDRVEVFGKRLKASIDPGKIPQGQYWVDVRSGEIRYSKKVRIK